jgi:hypothetical protein
MLKRVQHDKKKCVIPNLFRNLEFGNDNKSIAFAIVRTLEVGGRRQKAEGRKRKAI